MAAPAAEAPPVLALYGVSCRLGDREIVRGVDVAVRRGEFVSIVGPNGSGKTTLLRCMLGLVPYTGRVALEGADLGRLSRRAIGRRMAYVPQVVGAMPEFSVRELVMMGRYAHRRAFDRPSAEDRRAVDEAMALTSTADLAHCSIAALSGGELRRVLLASALSQSADIVLMDEPAASLDPHHEMSLYKILRMLHQDRKVTLIVVGHDLNRAAMESERAIGFVNGTVVFDGAPAALMTPQVLDTLYGASFLLVPHPQTGLDAVLPMRSPSPGER